MYRFLVAVLLIDAVILGAAVLLQAGKGGGLAASFGGAGSSPNSLLGSREAGNLLTKASWWCGGLFLGLALILQLMASHNTAAVPRSVLDPTGRQTQVPASAPARGAAPSVSTPLQPVAPVGGDAGKQPPAKQPPGGGKQPPSGKQP